MERDRDQLIFEDREKIKTEVINDIHQRMLQAFDLTLGRGRPDPVFDSMVRRIEKLESELFELTKERN